MSEALPTRRWRRWLGWAGLLSVLLLVSSLALARPGGGQSYSSGRSSYNGGSYGGGPSFGGGGGGDGGLIFYLLFELLFRHPLIGLPLLLIGGFLVWRWAQSRVPEGGWSSSAPNPPLGPGAEASSSGEELDALGRRPVPLPRDLAAQARTTEAAHGPRLPPREAIAALRESDPAFSLTLFEDWVYFLYAQVQTARGRHTLETLAPYLTAEVRAQLAGGTQGLTSVDEVIVGGLKLLRVAGLAPDSPTVEVRLQLETNYTERSADTRRTVWSVELWTLSRKRGAKSRPPDKVELLRCPNCGAPLEGIQGGVCGYCHQQVDRGDFDWHVTAVSVLDQVDRLPGPQGGELGGWVPTPTVREADADARLHDLLEQDPQLTWEAFVARAGLVFNELQVAWSTLHWAEARPFVTDSLYRSQTYWIERYQKQGLRNVTERARIERLELCAVDSDAVYDTLTVRLFARGLDYTLDSGGAVVEGSRSVEQRYSEYWTLVRGRGVKKAPVSTKNCPSCGAPLDINQAGVCAYCKAHITSGEFDWVLSRIEQDSAYG